MQTGCHPTSVRERAQIGTEPKMLCGEEAASQSSYGRQGVCVSGYEVKAQQDVCP